MENLTILEDPCILPEKKLKTLNMKQKLLYAPMSDVGDVLYDKDAVYINVPGIYGTKGVVKNENDQSESENDDDEDEDGLKAQKKKGVDVPNHKYSEGDHLVLNLQETKHTITDKLENSEVQLFRNSAPIKANEIREKKIVIQNENGQGQRVRRKAIFGNEDENSDSEDESYHALRIKENQK